RICEEVIPRRFANILGIDASGGVRCRVFDFDFALLFIAYNLQSDPGCSPPGRQIGGSRYALAVNRRDDVAGFQTGLFRGRTRFNRSNQHSLVALHSEKLAELRRQGFDLNTGTGPGPHHENIWKAAGHTILQDTQVWNLDPVATVDGRRRSSRHLKGLLAVVAQDLHFNGPADRGFLDKPG